MLGNIIGALTNASSAEDAIAAVGQPDLLARVQAASEADGIPIGSLVASKVRHVVEHGGEEIWVDLIGVMANSPQPGVDGVQRMLAYAFPPSTRVSIRQGVA